MSHETMVTVKRKGPGSIAVTLRNIDAAGELVETTDYVSARGLQGYLYKVAGRSDAPAIARDFLEGKRTPDKPSAAEVIRSAGNRRT